MRLNYLYLLCLAAINPQNAIAGLMTDRFTVQEFRDFAENLGRYTAGKTGIEVPEKNSLTSHILAFPMPDFGSVVSGGYATLYSPSYLASVKHNGGYKSVDFGNNAKFKTTYRLINRNEHSSRDFHLPRLNKVVTDAEYLPQVVNGFELKAHPERYVYYARAGAGTQSQLDSETGAEQRLAGAYDWKTGGTFSKIVFENWRLRWYLHGPSDPDVAPLEIGAKAGDSGSPMLVFDEVNKVWKLAGVITSIGGSGYDQRNYALYLQSDFARDVIAGNVAPDVNDTAGYGRVIWTQDAIIQGDRQWSWAGLSKKYKSLTPSRASSEELDSTKDLRFSGDGGSLTLEDAINMGAGKLQFSADYTVQPGRNPEATWAGGGIEVDEGYTVRWGVNGVADDALHKIGRGTLWINAKGANPGSLNTGEGTVVLDQQSDSDGNKQAFSSITLVSGRPTVVLTDADQVSTDKIFFGYRGGFLDLNGSSLRFREVNHTDSGAMLVNRNPAIASTVTLTGHGRDETEVRRWSSTRKGVPGDLYVYNNPYNNKKEYFRLKKSSYSYFPTDKSSTEIWEYIGEDSVQAISQITTERNRLVFRGFLGDRDPQNSQGELNLDISLPENTDSVMALTGGANITGSMRVNTGTLLLSGQPVPHAGGMVYEDDWKNTFFRARAINVQPGATLQIGNWANVDADISAAEGGKVMLGYRDIMDGGAALWRCFAVINTDKSNCSQATLAQNVIDAMPESSVRGDISLGRGAHLQLGKVMWQGSLTGQAQSSMDLTRTSWWQMTGSSVVNSLVAAPGSNISLLRAQNKTWEAKTLTVDNLDATRTSLSLGLDMSTGTGDKLVVRRRAVGRDNKLNIVPQGDVNDSSLLERDVVFADAPAGTDHGYFNMASLARGFTLYTPDYQVKEINGRVLWLLQGKSNSQFNDDINTHPDNGNEPLYPRNDNTSLPDNTNVPSPSHGGDASLPDSGDVPLSPRNDNASLPDNANVPSSPGAGDTSLPESGNIPSSADGKSAKDEKYKNKPGDLKPEEKNPQAVPESWLIAKENLSLINNTRSLMGTRRYLLDKAMDIFEEHMCQNYSGPEQNSTWANMNQTHGGYGKVNISRNVLSIGVHNMTDYKLYGLTASITRGNAKGAGHEEHNLYTAGAFYSWKKHGISLGLSAQYARLLQNIDLDPSLEIGQQRKSSDMLAASLRTEYRLPGNFKGFILQPFIELTGAAVSGYSMMGKETRISLSSGKPWSSTSGLSVDKTLTSMPLTLSANIGWRYSGAHGRPTLTLTDDRGHRVYREGADRSMQAGLGVEGKLAEDWSIAARMNYRTGGIYNDETGGSLGIRYKF